MPIVDRNKIGDRNGFLVRDRDRDRKSTAAFDAVFASIGAWTIKRPDDQDAGPGASGGEL